MVLIRCGGRVILHRVHGMGDKNQVTQGNPETNNNNGHDDDDHDGTRRLSVITTIHSFIH